MNFNPGEVLEPILHFLDEAIADYGVYAELGINSIMPSSG
jgi:hypothetical protein